MRNQTDGSDNTWPALDFLRAAEHPVFRQILVELLIAVDRGGCIVSSNHAFQAVSGFGESELAGEHFSMLYPEHQREDARACFAEQLKAGEFSSDVAIPFRNKSGETFYIHFTVTVLTDVDGGIEYIVGTGIDTTAHAGGIDQQKFAENTQLRQLEQQRNALVRELHHRIKNNLQGIVGLLRGSLKNADDPEAAVEKAITQINSIALIHGIHGQSAGRELLLCEMVPAIVKNHTLPTHGELRIDLTLRVDASLQLLDDEAVPVALILNELITNAIKHANKRHAGDRVSISLSVADDRGDISIHSPGSCLPEGFDFPSGSGYGTGLELIHALLPPEGMSIQYRQTRTGVTTDVQLHSPVVRRYVL